MPSRPDSPVLGALVIGCGAVGSGYDDRREGAPPLTHAGAYAAHARTDLAGGVDPDSTARRRFEARWHVPAYARLEEALDRCRPAVASVATPVSARADVVDVLVDAGVRAIWVEKPLAGTKTEAAGIVSRCASAAVALQVNFLRRFDALHRQVAVSLDAPFHADFRFSGSLANYGAHAFDLFRWYAGEVSAADVGPTVQGEPVVLLQAEGGSTATFSRVRGGDADMFECDFYSGHGRLTLSELGRTLVRWQPRPSDLFDGVIVLGGPVVDPEKGLDGAMLAGVDSVVAHLDDAAPLLCDGHDGVAALAIEEAVREAQRVGTSVLVEAV